MRTKKVRSNTPVSILMPAPLQQALIERAEREDLTFSQIVRRAVRKEFGLTEAETEGAGK